MSILSNLKSYTPLYFCMFKSQCVFEGESRSYSNSDLSCTQQSAYVYMCRFNVKELIENRPKSLCFCSLKYIKCWVDEFHDLPHYATTPPWCKTSRGVITDQCSACSWTLFWPLSRATCDVFTFYSQTCVWNAETHLICICGSHDSSNKSHQTLTFGLKSLTEAFQTLLEVEDHISTQSRLHSFSPEM